MEIKDMYEIGYYFFLIKFLVLAPIGMIVGNIYLANYGVWCGVLALLVRSGIILGTKKESKR